MSHENLSLLTRNTTLTFYKKPTADFFLLTNIETRPTTFTPSLVDSTQPHVLFSDDMSGVSDTQEALGARPKENTSLFFVKPSQCLMHETKPNGKTKHRK